MERYYEVPEARDTYHGIKGWVFLDEEIAEVIQILNEKGFITDFCCAGHWIEDNHKGQGYIAFCQAPPFGPMTVPFHWDEKPGAGWDGVLRWEAQSEEQLEKCHRLLLEWAHVL